VDSASTLTAATPFAESIYSHGDQGLEPLPTKAPGAHSSAESSAEILQKADRLTVEKQSHAGVGKVLTTNPPSLGDTPASTVKVSASTDTFLALASSASTSAATPIESSGITAPTGSATVPVATIPAYIPPKPPSQTGSPLPVAPRDFIYPSFRQRLETTPIATVVPNLGSVVIARSTESVASVFQKLIDFKIQAVPLLRVSTNQFVAFVDLVDILALLVDRLGLTNRANWSQIEHWMAQAQFQGPCEELVVRSVPRHEWFAIAAAQPLAVAIQQMSRHSLHRLAISDLENNFVSLLSQSRVVSWLTAFLDAEEAFAPLSALTLEDLKLGYRPVLSVPSYRLALDAFMFIYQHRVTAVAVTDQDQRLSGVVSLSDLKDIGSTGAMFGKLLVPVGQFIQSKVEGSQHLLAYYVTRTDTVRTVLEILCKFRIHRVFVVNNALERRLVGVVTTSDVLALFDSTTPLSR